MFVCVCVCVCVMYACTYVCPLVWITAECILIKLDIAKSYQNLLNKSNFG